MDRKEIQPFLNALRKLALDARLSHRAMADLMGVSPSTMNRWLDEHRENRRMDDYMVVPVQRNLRVLTAVNDDTDLFKTLHHVNPKARLAALKDVLRQHTEN